MNWAPPGPWLREYIQAVRAVWHAYRPVKPAHKTVLLISLMVPLFDPGPLDKPDIPIVVAGVTPPRCGEVGDDSDRIHLHPQYIDGVMRPAIEDCAARSGRDAGEVRSRSRRWWRPRQRKHF